VAQLGRKLDLCETVAVCRVEPGEHLSEQPAPYGVGGGRL